MDGLGKTGVILASAAIQPLTWISFSQIKNRTTHQTSPHFLHFLPSVEKPPPNCIMQFSLVAKIGWCPPWCRTPKSIPWAEETWIDGTAQSYGTIQPQKDVTSKVHFILIPHTTCMKAEPQLNRLRLRYMAKVPKEMTHSAASKESSFPMSSKLLEDKVRRTKMKTLDKNMGSGVCRS